MLPAFDQSFVGYLTPFGQALAVLPDPDRGLSNRAGTAEAVWSGYTVRWNGLSPRRCRGGVGVDLLPHAPADSRTHLGCLGLMAPVESARSA